MIWILLIPLTRRVPEIFKERRRYNMRSHYDKSNRPSGWNWKWELLSWIGWFICCIGVAIIMIGITLPIYNAFKTFKTLYIHSVIIFHAWDMIFKPLLILMLGVTVTFVGTGIESIIADKFNDWRKNDSK